MDDRMNARNAVRASLPAVGETITTAEILQRAMPLAPHVGRSGFSLAIDNLLARSGATPTVRFPLARVRRGLCRVGA